MQQCQKKRIGPQMLRLNNCHILLFFCPCCVEAVVAAVAVAAVAPAVDANAGSNEQQHNLLSPS